MQRTPLGPVGVGASSGSTSATQPRPKVVYLTYLTLSDLRQWTTSNGKTFLGKLIAFEDAAVTTTGKVTSATPVPGPPGRPIVVRKGRVRFLIDSKPYETALEILSEPDRKLVQGVEAAVTAQSQSASAPKP